VNVKIQDLTPIPRDPHSTIAGLEIQLTEKEAEQSEQKGVLTNALIDYFKCARLSRGVPDYDGWKVSDCLEKISDLLDRGGRFDPPEVTEVTAFLKSLPSAYEPLTKKIQRKLAT